MEKVTNIKAELVNGKFNIYFTFRKRVWNVEFSWKDIDLTHYEGVSNLWDYWTGADGWTFEITAEKDGNGFPTTKGMYINIYPDDEDDYIATSMEEDDYEGDDGDDSDFNYAMNMIVEDYSTYLSLEEEADEDERSKMYAILARKCVNSVFWKEAKDGHDEAIHEFMANEFPDVYNNYDYNYNISYLVMSIAELCGDYFCDTKEYNDCIRRHELYVKLAKAILEMDTHNEYKGYSLDEVLEVYMKYHYPQAFTMNHVEK